MPHKFFDDKGTLVDSLEQAGMRKVVFDFEKEEIIDNWKLCITLFSIIQLK